MRTNYGSCVSTVAIAMACLWWSGWPAEAQNTNEEPEPNASIVYQPTTNLLTNGDFETVGLYHEGLPLGWDGRQQTRAPGRRGMFFAFEGLHLEDSPAPLGKSGAAVRTDYDPFEARMTPYDPNGAAIIRVEGDAQSGKYCMRMVRTGSDAFCYLLRHKPVPVQPGRLYRLRFHVKTDELSREMAGYDLVCQGAEGPSYVKRFVHVEKPNQWQQVEAVFRAQVEFNPIHSVELELKMFQWQPSVASDKTQSVDFDNVCLERMPAGEATSTSVGSRWLIPPGRPQLRFADVEFGCGRGVTTVEESVELRRDGTRLTRVPDLDSLKQPDQFAFSGRSRRVYVASSAAAGRMTLRYIPAVDASAGGFLNMPPDDGSSVSRAAGAVKRIPLSFTAPAGADRKGWPATQGLPFAAGELADAKAMRLLDPQGKEVPCQVRVSSLWPDDSIRWVLLDFQVDLKAAQSADYVLEYGKDVRRAAVDAPLQVADSADAVTIDTGRLRFRVSKRNFSLLQDVVVDGAKPLSAPPVLKTVDECGNIFTTDASRPYALAVEEAGPLRAAIVARGWNIGEGGRRFLAYTTRIHAYRGANFVRVFHTVTNRNDEITPVRQDRFELPGLKLSDLALRLPLAAQPDARWTMPASPALEGPAAETPTVHRQAARLEGTLKTGSAETKTGELPGIVTVRGKDYAVTAAVCNYAKLFPKELRVGKDFLELGLIPYSQTVVHPLLSGTARTTEMLLAFDGPSSADGPAAAQAFVDPPVFASPAQYCDTGGIRGFPIPHRPGATPFFDAICDGALKYETSTARWSKDTCGLMNYPDMGGESRNQNLEYDVDFGFQTQFARTGRADMFLHAQDLTRHFLDTDMMWYSPNPWWSGSNLQHERLHYGPGEPSGHAYTMGMIHYYLLTGDRRGLEGARSLADAIHRYRYDYLKTRSTYLPNPLGRSAKGDLDYRNFSETGMQALTVYEYLGEERFRECSFFLLDCLMRATSGIDDIHYRYPPQLYTMWTLTERDDVKEFIRTRCNEVTDETRAVRGRAEWNTREFYNCIFAWSLWGNRRGLDSTMDMWDEFCSKARKGWNERLDRNWMPIVVMGLVEPHLMVYLTPQPKRFDVAGQPFQGAWKLTVRNVYTTPVEGTVEIPKLPPGLMVPQPRQAFKLEPQQETTVEFPLEIAPTIARGKTEVWYTVSTVGADGHKAERNSLFAIYSPFTDPQAVKKLPKLLFHAPLDGNGVPAVSNGAKDPMRIDGVGRFEPGRIGQCYAARGYRGTFNIENNLFSESGTLAVWLKPRTMPQPLEHCDTDLRNVIGTSLAVITFDTKNVGNAAAVFENQRLELGPLTRDTWHHVAVTWTMEEVRVYLDGKPVTVTPQAKPPKLKKGEAPPPPSATRPAEFLKRVKISPPGDRLSLEPWWASIDDLRIYSVPLAEEEVAKLAAP